MTDDAPGVTAWIEQTSAFDRVHTVATTVSRPRSASYIADEAHVAENTARDHLARLVDMNVLLESDEEGTALYSPDPLHTRMQTLRNLLEDHDHEALIELKADMQEQIEVLKRDYDANSPADLRERAAETTEAEATRDIATAASDWELVLYRLSVVEDAIENYTTYNRDYRASA